MRKLQYCLAATAVFAYGAAAACQFHRHQGASTDGSYGLLCRRLARAVRRVPHPATRGQHHDAVYEWDTGRYLTDIPQLRETYSTVGNMNEHSLIISETTYGGRPELADSTD
ncbi:MAG: hypothetical protein ACLRMJ_01610 [Alistipes finegoldii]